MRLLRADSPMYNRGCAFGTMTNVEEDRQPLGYARRPRHQRPTWVIVLVAIVVAVAAVTIPCGCFYFTYVKPDFDKGIWP